MSSTGERWGKQGPADRKGEMWSSCRNHLSPSNEEFWKWIGPSDLFQLRQRSWFCTATSVHLWLWASSTEGMWTLDKATFFKWRPILHRGTQLWTISGQPPCQLENESSIPVGSQGDGTQHPLLPILCVLFASYKELIFSEKKQNKTYFPGLDCSLFLE